MEVKSDANNQLGVFATKSFAVGDVICKEKAPLLRLAPVGIAQESALVSAWNSKKKSSPGSAAKKHTSNETFWQVIAVPSTIPEAYHGIFKGMVQAGLCWTVLCNEDEDQPDRETFLKLYAPSIEKHTKEEEDIIDVAQKAVQYLADHGVTGDELLSVLLIWACNSFEQGRVYNTISRFNHSCDPNAVVQPIQDVTNHNDGQRIVAAAPIAEGEEICISYLGLLLYAERPVRQQHLKQTKHFSCACPRCCNAKMPDFAAAVPCLQCHPRAGRQLDEDTQYDDEQKVNYVAPQSESGVVVLYTCAACQKSMEATNEKCVNALKAGKKVVDKVVTFFQDYDRRQRPHEATDDDDDDEEVQDELLDQHIRMASTVLGARHWTTNLLLLLQVDRSLQSLHGSMLTADPPEESSSLPDLDSIAATVDSLERIVRFANGLKLKLHMGHLVGDAIIGLARALVALVSYARISIIPVHSC